NSSVHDDSRDGWIFRVRSSCIFSLDFRLAVFVWRRWRNIDGSRRANHPAPYTAIETWPREWRDLHGYRTRYRRFGNNCPAAAETRLNSDLARARYCSPHPDSHLLERMADERARSNGIDSSRASNPYREESECALRRIRTQRCRLGPTH